MITITFYDLKERNHDKIFDSFTMISSDVGKDEPKEVILSVGNSPIKKESTKFSFIDK